MRRAHVPEFCMPYPEIVEALANAVPYQIGDADLETWLPTNGMTDKVRRRLIVPLQPHGRPVSRHELAHVIWSPLKLPRVRFDVRVLMAVEDARINLGLLARGLAVALRAADRATVCALAAKDLSQRQVAQFVLRAIAAIGTNVEAEIRAPAEDEPTVRELAASLSALVRATLERDRRRRGERVASFACGLRVARRVARHLEALGLIEPGARPVATEAICCGWHEVDGDGGGEADGGRRPRRRLRLPGDARVPPGRLRTVVAPLDRRSTVPAWSAGRAWRPATEGSVVRSLHRLPIDGAIFRRPGRRRGGTVLIDTSGSMSLSAADVGRILAHAPSTTQIAIYSGRGSEGELRIVARAGRHAGDPHLTPFAKGNVVDLPALQWLARQRRPRVWVSDGGVTGCNDRASAALARACMALCQRAGIQRVDGAAEAAAALQGRRRGA